MANLSDEEFLEYLVKLYGEYGRPPTSVDLDEVGRYPHLRTYYRRYKYTSDSGRKGTWNDILNLAGITPL